jgi:hypothetical protein
VSFPPVTPTAGGGITGGPGSGPATPTGPPVVHTTPVTIAPPPPPISTPKTFVGYDQVGDQLQVVFAPGGDMITKLDVTLRLRCVTVDGADVRFTGETIALTASNLSAAEFGDPNIKYHDIQSNPTRSLQITGTSRADNVHFFIHHHVEFPYKHTTKNCDSSGVPGAGSFRALLPGQAPPTPPPLTLSDPDDPDIEPDDFEYNPRPRFFKTCGRGSHPGFC